MKWLLLLCCFYIILPFNVAGAVVVSSQVSKNELQRSETTEYVVKLLATTSVNAVEGTIVFDDNLLAVDQINDAGSIVSLWVRQPHVRDQGAITFSGIIPGGVSGEELVLFRVRFRAIATGTTDITWSALRVLAHDGKGSDLPVVTQPVTLRVLADDLPSLDSLATDDVAPEIFTPVTGDDEAIAGGQKYIVFATTDKGSGVAAYYVREYRFPWLRTLTRFRPVSSPYVLQDQSGKSFVEVKAVDYGGNEQIVVAVAGEKGRSVFSYSWVLVVIVFFCLLLRKKRHNKRVNSLDVA